MFVLVAHFRIGPAVPGRDAAGPGVPDRQAEERGAAIPGDALEPLTMLAASGRCTRMHFARSADTAGRFVLVAEFESAAAYRQALSPWPMRTVFIPWLSTAEVEVSEVSEVLFSSVEGRVVVTEPTVTDPAR